MMAGRVLRTSDGRFAGSTRGWQRGNKKAGVNRARLAKNNDIYVTRVTKGPGNFKVMERHVSNKELAKRAGVASLAGALGGAYGGKIALRLVDNKARAEGDGGTQVGPAYQRASEARAAARLHRKTMTTHRIRGVLVRSALPLGMAAAVGVGVTLRSNPAMRAQYIAYGRAINTQVRTFRRAKTFQKVNRIQAQQRAYAMRRMGRTLTTGGISRAKRNMFTNSFKITTL